MRVMAFHAVHLALEHRVVLRQLKFPLLLAVAFETCRGVLAGIDDELAPAAAARDVQATRPMTRFAARLTDCAGVCELDAGMGAGWKDTRDAAMAIGAGFVADEGSAGNGGWRGHRPRGGTGIHQEEKAPGYAK